MSNSTVSRSMHRRLAIQVAPGKFWTPEGITDDANAASRYILEDLKNRDSILYRRLGEIGKPRGESPRPVLVSVEYVTTTTVEEL
jgi:hypothetical protein